MESADSRYWVWRIVAASICLFQFINHGCDVSGANPRMGQNFESSKALSLLQLRGTNHAAAAFHARSHIVRGRKLTASSNDPASSSREAGALLAFKDSVTSDPLKALDSWRANDTDPCLWRGVRCSTLSGNVVGLNLSSLQLVGILPERLGYLEFLERLDLSNNLLSGSIQDSIANCSNLFYFDISHNQVSGKIPSQIGELWHLRTFDVTGNNLTGVIPEAIGNCSSLHYLSFSINCFEGVIPLHISQLSDLAVLDISNNSLSGSIPVSMINCSNLFYLDISYNQVSGEIPSQIGELWHLQILDASGNNLTGVIPEAIGNCSFLAFLGLVINSLEGVIPSHISQLSRLAYLDLSQNSLSGSIPGSLGNCSSIRTLGVAENFNLGGELPQELSQLTKGTEFILNSCNFVGAFPTWVTNLTSLSNFQLAQNSLSGEISNEIGHLLKNLTYLVLAGNQLTGPIPTSIVNCTSLARLVLQNNKLTGNIPPDIGFLSNYLEVFRVENNLLSGVIPSSMSNCSALISLNLGHNLMIRQRIPFWIESLSNMKQILLDDLNLYGEIPPGLGKLSNLNFLSLTTNYLGGGLPSSLGNLSLLHFLQVSENQLHGQIPSEIGNLSSLFSLVLGENVFVGSIPSFSNLKELTIFEIPVNLFTGTIDSNIGARASQLQILSIHSNNFSGPLPEGIGNFSKLQSLDLSRNSFTASIPSSWGNLTNLQSLKFSQNKVEGELPVDLTRCFQLLTLGVSGNRLEGSIPWAIGQLVTLETLDVHNNFFSGLIPSSFANLSKMQILDLGFNAFSGTIAGGALSKMQSTLIHLDLSHNFLSGFWSPEFNLLKSLQHLDVSANNISGPMLQGLIACVGLTKLDVSHNNLTGMIPPDLGLLQHLQFFDASFNSFEGPIPTMGLFKTKNITRASFLGNPKLCGSTTLVHQPCSLTSSTHSSRTFRSSGRWILLSSSLWIILMAAVGTMCCRRKRNRHGDCVIKDIGIQGRIALSDQEVMRIIQGGPDHVIGSGSKSTVYKGDLSSGEKIALKVLHSDFRTGDPREMDERATQELLREVHTLAKLRHLNITKIFGLVISPDVKALILEYMPKGSLHNLLYNDTESGQVEIFSLQDRLKIILGIAESLVYLHHSFHDPIIHRDLKPSNILLGMDLQPKLNDFGISKFARQSTSGELEASASTLCGTFGYIPPEYATQATVSTRGDVYSFGVVLLELLTRKSPTSEEDFGASGDLVSFVADSFEEMPFQVLDSTLIQEWEINSMAKDQMMLLLRVGLLCTRWAAKDRPDMKDVLEMLKQIKDMELEVVPCRSVEELAHDITVWGTAS